MDPPREVPDLRVTREGASVFVQAGPGRKSVVPGLMRLIASVCVEQKKARKWRRKVRKVKISSVVEYHEYVQRTESGVE